MSDRRGEIRNRARRLQILDMRGMRFDQNITPTDIDGFIDYHDQKFAFFELKLIGTALGRGQETALVRLVNRIDQGGAVAALFVAEHDVHDPADDVQVDRATVKAIYERRKWRDVAEFQTLREAVDLFLGFTTIKDGTVSASTNVAPVNVMSDAILRDPKYLAELEEYRRRRSSGSA